MPPNRLIFELQDESTRPIGSIQLEPNYLKANAIDVTSANDIIHFFENHFNFVIRNSVDFQNKYTRRRNATHLVIVGRRSPRKSELTVPATAKAEPPDPDKWISRARIVGLIVKTGKVKVESKTTIEQAFEALERVIVGLEARIEKQKEEIEEQKRKINELNESVAHYMQIETDRLKKQLSETSVLNENQKKDESQDDDADDAEESHDDDADDRPKLW